MRACLSIIFSFMSLMNLYSQDYPGINYFEKMHLEMFQSSEIQAPREIYVIDAGWRFSEAGMNEWHDAHEKINVHLNLFQQKLIPNPYAGTEEKNLQWIEEKEWEYKVEFYLPRDSTYTSCELQLSEVYTFADVYFNDRLVLQTSNTFRTWKVNVFDLIRPDTLNNSLRIVFHSTVNKGKELMKNYAYTLPGDERLFVRTPQYQFGWDFAPRFVITGMQNFPKFTLKKKNSVFVNDVQVIQKKLSKRKAQLDAILELETDQAQKIYLPHPNNKRRKGKYFELKPGKNKITYRIKIRKPDLWWPAGYNAPMITPLYFTVQDKPSGKHQEVNYFDEKFVPYALCHIELIQNKDSIGKGFYLRVNGVPIYAKGVNIVPGDSFDPMQGYDPLYNTDPYLLRKVKNLNANMIRVWGGGTYMDESFYLYCMLNGIMVWQDFPFGGGMIPGDANYTNNVKEEIKQQVARLRNYNNIAIWCGNNEMNEGWNNWGWQKQYNYTKNDSAAIWNDYYTMFHQTIPGVLKELDPKKSYIPSSPEYGWGRNQSMTHGDSHYWGVWWGKEPIEKYNEKVPRFMSEFGMQSAPHQNVFRHFNSNFQMISDTGMYLFSPELKNHQKHATGFETLNAYLKKYYTIPEIYTDYSFSTQLLQAEAMRTAIEAQRRNMPSCMGSLAWQLNDCWPGISWSIIDYTGKEKIAWHTIKTAFDFMLISVKEETDRYDFYIVSEYETAEKDSLIIYISDFNGKKLFSENLKIKIEPMQSKVYYSIPRSKLANIPLDKVFMYYSLGKNQYENTFHFVKPNQLKLPAPEIELNFSNERYLGKVNDSPYYEYEYQLEITSGTYVPFFMIYSTDMYYPFILPGKKITRRYPVSVPLNHQFNKEEAIVNLKKEMKSLPQLLQIK